MAMRNTSPQRIFPTMGIRYFGCLPLSTVISCNPVQLLLSGTAEFNKICASGLNGAGAKILEGRPSCKEQMNADGRRSRAYLSPLRWRGRLARAGGCGSGRSRGERARTTRRELLNDLRRALPVGDRAVGTEVSLGAGSHTLRVLRDLLQLFHVEFD